MTFLPSVIEKVGNTTRAFDLPSKLLDDRIVYLQGEINEESANAVIMQLLWLNSYDPNSSINLIINSPGGEIYQGLAIKDIIDQISAEVNTTGVGVCASMGAYLLFSGTGVRKASKNCRIMIHSASSGTAGNIHDMVIDLKETQYLQEKMLKHISEFSRGRTSLEELETLTLRDKFLSPEETIELGLIDKIL